MENLWREPVASLRCSCEERWLDSLVLPLRSAIGVLNCQDCQKVRVSVVYRIK